MRWQSLWTARYAEWRWVVLGVAVAAGIGACSKAPEPSSPNAAAGGTAQAVRTAQAVYEAQALYDADSLYSAENMYASNEISISSVDSQSVIVSGGLGNLFKAIQSKKGSRVIVVFWAPWDPASTGVANEVTRLAKIVQADNVAFFSVAVRTDIDTQIRPYAKNNFMPDKLYVLDVDAPALKQSLPCQTSWDGSLSATFVFGTDGALKQEFLRPAIAQEVLSALGPVQSSKTLPVGG